MKLALVVHILWQQKVKQRGKSQTKTKRAQIPFHDLIWFKCPSLSHLLLHFWTPWHKLPNIALFSTHPSAGAVCPWFGHSGVFWPCSWLSVLFLLDLSSAWNTGTRLFPSILPFHPRLVWDSLGLGHSDHTQDGGVPKLHPCLLLLCYLPGGSQWYTGIS